MLYQSVGSSIISIPYRWCSIYFPYIFHMCSIYIPILYRYGIYMEHYWIMNWLFIVYKRYDGDNMKKEIWDECVSYSRFRVWRVWNPDKTGCRILHLKGLSLEVWNVTWLTRLQINPSNEVTFQLRDLGKQPNIVADMSALAL